MSLEVHGGRSFAEATILYAKAVDALGKRVNDEDSDYDEDAPLVKRGKFNFFTCVRAFKRLSSEPSP